MPNTDLHRLHRSETIDGGSACACACAGEREGEQGFLLLGLIVAIFLILLALGVAAPRAAHELRREREVETVRRGNAYVRAIEVYYLKMGNYPTSIEQLEKTNNVRFLRKRYMDPMTGKDDWRVIHLGEAKTTVKGFFGKPLGGIESTSLGGSSSGAGSTGSAFGSSSSSGSGGLTSSFGSSSDSGSGGLTSSFGSSSSGAGSTGSSSSTSGTSSGSNGIGSGSGIGSGIGAQATAGPIVGIGLVKSGNSIRTLNEQTTYETWEFLYDPRIEQLKAKVSLFGGGMASTDAANLGSAADSKSSTSGDLNFGSGSSSGSQSTGSGLGSGSFDSSSGFGSGSSSSPSPAPTTNTPQ